MQVYINGGSTLLGTFESPGRIWTYYQVNHPSTVNDVLFYFLDIPNSNRIYIDDIRIRATCHTPTPLPSPTPVCPDPKTWRFLDGFEAGLGTWIVQSQGLTNYGITSVNRHSGVQSFVAGPSNCHEHCYGNNSVTLSRVFPKPLSYIRLGFWLYTDGLVGSYTQVISYSTEIGSTLLGTFQPGPSWTYYEVEHAAEINELRFYFVDVTDINRVFLDDVDMYTETCASVPSFFVQVDH
jgi:hypothetical protein